MTLDHLQNALRFAQNRPSSKLFRDYLLRRLPKKEVPISIDSIPFLCHDETMTDLNVKLDFSTGGGCVLFVSPTGAGKTYAMRGLLGDLFNSGYACVDLSSIKNDFYWSMYSVQNKFKRWLPFWRNAEQLPIFPFVPRYIQKKQGRVRGFSQMKIGQLSIRDIQAEDLWKSCFNLSPEEPKAHLIQYLWSGRKPKNWEDLIKKIQKINTNLARKLQIKEKEIKFRLSTTSSLLRQIGRMKTAEVFGDNHPMNFVDLINKDWIPSLCFNWARGPEMKKYHSIYISAILRQIHNAKKEGKISRKRIVYFFDDIATTACPRLQNPACKDIILNDIASLGRQLGEYIVAGTQTLSQIPDELIEQAHYIIFFEEISGEELRRIAKIRKRPYSLVRRVMGVWKDGSGNWHSGKFRNKKIRDGRRTCIVWHKSGRSNFGWVPAPSTKHKEQE